MPYFIAQQLDVTLFYLINHLPHSAALNAIATAMRYGTRGGLIYLPLLLILAAQKKYRRPALLTAGAGLSTFLIVDLILKPLVQRPRPFSALMNVALLPPVPHSWSFPSGETALAFAVATMCTLAFPGRYWRFMWLWAVMVSFQRIYSGQHYPADVVAGAAIGIIIAYGVYKLSGSKVTNPPAAEY